jgi:CHAD domain-containing protein
MAVRSSLREAGMPPAPQVFDAPGIRQVTEYVRHTVFGTAARRAASFVVPSRTVVERVPLDAGAWHLRYSLERRLGQLQRFHDFESARDPVEAVHDFRVASRALRAYLHLFEPFVNHRQASDLRKHLKKCTRAVGKLRESDVNALEIARLLQGTDERLERAALEHLLARLERQRAKERARAKRRLMRVDVAKIRVAARRALEECLSLAASEPGRLEMMAWLGLEPLLSQVQDAADACRGEDRGDELHALRILTKRLRYGVELFEPVFAESHKALHTPLKRMQELLGDHHDQVVLIDLLEQHHAELVRDHKHTLASGLEPSIAKARAERAHVFEKFQAQQEHLDLESAAALAEKTLRHIP